MNIGRIRNQIKKVDKNDLGTYYTLFTTAIIVGIFNLIAYILTLLDGGIIFLVKNDIINSIVTILLYYTVSVLIMIEIALISYCYYFIYNNLKKKKTSLLRLNSLLLLIFQGTTSCSIIVMIWIISMLVYDFTNESYFWYILTFLVGISGYYKLKKWSDKKRIHILPSYKAFIITVTVSFLLLSVLSYYFIHIFSPIKLEKLIYTTADTQAIIKLPGYASKVEIVRDNVRYSIPFRTYYLNYSMYLILDFSSPLIVEGKYHVKTVINNVEKEQEFIYCFKGSLDDRNKYIDKYLIRAKNEFNNINIESDLKELREAALSKDEKSYKSLLDKSAPNLPPNVQQILKELSFNETCFNASTIDSYFLKSKEQFNNINLENDLAKLKEAALSGNKSKYQELLNNMIPRLPPKILTSLIELSLDKVIFN